MLPSHTSPNDLLSITTFDNPKKDGTVNTSNQNAKVKAKENASNDETEDSDNAHAANEMEVENDRPRKRKVSSGESLIKDNDMKTKKIRIVDDQSAAEHREKNSVENEEISNKTDNHNKSKKRKRVMLNDTNDVEDVDKKISKTTESATKSCTEEEEEEIKDRNKINSSEANALEVEEHSAVNIDAVEREVGEERENEGKKKKRKRNRNKIHEQDVMCNMGLQVMAKPDWKRLRNRYLELQRSKMSLLKQHLKKAEVGRGEIIIKNRYHDKPKREKNNEAEKSIYGCVNYAPGIIVKIEMDEPCTDPRSFKVR